MQRRPTTQDITWLIDLHRNKQLDLEPSYQRRSVWTAKDRQYFLDTIFRNYPSPAIFLHKTIDEFGKATYHVVDGKQRTETILMFIDNKIRIARDFGDNRLNGKKWSDLQGESELKQALWNYQLTVEMIDFDESALVNEVFDRLNRNSRKLTSQELRHAKYDGWFISFAEKESNSSEWRELGVVTTARAKRMSDVQYISELLLVVLENRIIGFDQYQLDELYAKYDDPTETLEEFDEENFLDKLGRVKNYLREMEDHNNAVTKHAKALAHLYTLWSVIALNDNIEQPGLFAEKYDVFLDRVNELASQEDLSAYLQAAEPGTYSRALTYLDNFRGANTDLGPRKVRYDALLAATSE